MTKPITTKIVKIVKISAPWKSAKFVWTGEECEMSSVGIEDDEIDTLIDLGAHEGIGVDGYTTTHL